MNDQLTSSEKQFLDEFLKTANQTKMNSVASFLFAGLISVLGLILFIFATVFTLNNLTDRIVYWVLFPGMIGGLGTILFGMLLMKHFKKAEEKKKLAGIIRKIMEGGASPFPQP